MSNVFAQSSRLRRSAFQRPVRAALIISSAAILPVTAWADCTPAGAAANSTVTCDGDSASYSNTNSGLKVTADSTAVVTAPLVIGSSGSLTVASGGQIEGTNAVATVQYGDNATIVNNGTITASSSTSGAAAIQVGMNSTVTNNGTLTATSSTPAVSFAASTASSNASTNGTFINGATAPTAVTGNIEFGNNSGTSRGTFINDFNTTTTATSTATYGLTGNVTGSGNITIDNEGAWTGSLTQSAFDPVGSAASTVVFENGKKANFSGTIVTADATTVTNDATGENAASVVYAMALGNGTKLGSAGTTSSSLINNGYLTLGSSSAPALVTINGSFTQSSTGTLNVFVVPNGSTTVSTSNSSQPYSQIDAVGGTATISGTLNVNVETGTSVLVGSKYDFVLADNGITGSFDTVNVTNANGDKLVFITFGNGSKVTLSGTQQAYEFTVSRVGTYATDIQAAGAGTPNQLAVATALNPIVKIADAAGSTSTTNESTLINEIDQLTVAQATTLFDQMSPAGLLSYANALRDEANNFERAIWLRMDDQNSDHAEDGWWGSANGQADVSKATTDSSKQTMFGFNLGYDLSGPHHVFGIAGNVSFDSLHNLNSTLKGKNRDFAIAGYGGYKAGPIHLTGQLAYNFGHLSTTRTLTVGAATDTATGKAGEHLFKAVGTAGFMLHAAGYTFEPFGGIDFMRGKVNGFTETGDGAAALTVLPISANRTDVLAGLSLTRSSGKLRPYVRAVYRSELGNSAATTVSAYFDGNTDTTFTVTGVPAARHEEDINAGVNFVFEDAGSLFVGYQGTLRTGYSSHGINLGLRLEF